jgi:hypothetical protein
VSLRSPAERRVDLLSAEARELRQIPRPSPRQAARLYEIEAKKLPAAWQAVHDMRAGRR